MKIEYVRIKFKTAGGRVIFTWAQKLGPISFRIVNREGDWGEDGVDRRLLGRPEWEKPAHMDKKYAVLTLS